MEKKKGKTWLEKVKFEIKKKGETHAEMGLRNKTLKSLKILFVLEKEKFVLENKTFAGKGKLVLEK